MKQETSIRSNFRFFGGVCTTEGAVLKRCVSSGRDVGVGIDIDIDIDVGGIVLSWEFSWPWEEWRGMDGGEEVDGGVVIVIVVVGAEVGEDVLRQAFCSVLDIVAIRWIFLWNKVEWGGEGKRKR